MTSFEDYRPLLFSIAYRMLGSVMEAEDMVQETYLRYSAIAPQHVTAPKSYLCKIITNLCLDHLKSAQAQREVYTGMWLPEPLLTDDMEQDDTISLAFLMLLERLSPAERAVFVLHEVFDYGYKEIAEMVGREEAACRQLLHRARQHIAAHRPRYSVNPDTHQSILNQFLAAVAEGDLDGLSNLLAEDAASASDGGGKVAAATRTVFGRGKVARFILGLVKRAGDMMTMRIANINGRAALILLFNDRPFGVLMIETDERHIQRIWIQVNPDKLTHLTQ